MDVLTVAERTVPALVDVFMSFNYLTLLSALAIAGGLYFFFVGFHLVLRRRLVLSTPTSTIRSAALGLVEVNGRAVGPNTMPAPISGKPCFLYRVIAWQRPNGKKDWQKVADETLHQPFFIDDTTGQMLIEPLGADLDLERDVCEEFVTSIFSSANDVPLRVSTFLARHNAGNDRPLRIEEFLIKPDDSLFFTGTVTENPGIEVRPLQSKAPVPAQPAVSRDAREPEVIKLYGGTPASSATDMTQQGKIAAALVRAGITKPEAWSVAGVPYQPVAIENNLSGSTMEKMSALGNQSRNSADALKDQSERASFDLKFNLKPPVVLMKGDKDSMFVVSCESQKEILSSLGWKSTAMVWGGGAITALGLYMLLEQLGISL